MKIQTRPDEVVGNDQIAKRAYEIWQTNGSLHGSDVEDWLQAKAELLAAELLAAYQSGKAAVQPKGSKPEIVPIAANVR
jgi:hypothetical protein